MSKKIQNKKKRDERKKSRSNIKRYQPRIDPGKGPISQGAVMAMDTAHQQNKPLPDLQNQDGRSSADRLYAYVFDDVKRIGILALMLFVLLFIIYFILR